MGARLFGVVLWPVALLVVIVLALFRLGESARRGLEAILTKGESEGRK